VRKLILTLLVLFCFIGPWLFCEGIIKENEQRKIKGCECVGK